MCIKRKTCLTDGNSINGINSLTQQCDNFSVIPFKRCTNAQNSSNSSQKLTTFEENEAAVVIKFCTKPRST